MERIAISSSIKFKDEIRTVLQRARELGLEAVFPNLDASVSKEDVDLEFMRRLERDHFKAIDGCEALYVICPNGYVGTLVSVEIGYAKAQNKLVIFSETPEDLGLQALVTTYVSMDELQKIKEMSAL